MDRRSYFDVAQEDFKFLEFYYSHLDEAPNYNAIVVQEQQIVEKFLKFLIDKYVDSADAIDILHSHKLANIASVVNKSCDLEIDLDEMRFLSDFYFDGRYPSRDYVIATIEDAKRGYNIVKEIRESVMQYVSGHESVVKLSCF